MKDLTALKIWSTLNSIVLVLLAASFLMLTDAVAKHQLILDQFIEFARLMKDVTQIHVYPTEGGGRGGGSRLQWSNEPEVTRQ